MNKNIVLAVAALVFAFASASLALGNRQFSIPVDANGIAPTQYEQYGVSVATDSAGTPQDNQGIATQGKLWASGPGVLYDVVVGSDTGGSSSDGGSWVACIDASAAEDFDSTDTDIVLLALVNRIVDVETSASASSPAPVEFKLGLVCDSNENIYYFPKFRSR